MIEWRKYNGALISNRAPHIHSNSENISLLLKKEKAFLARWVSDFDCKKETDFWYIICDKNKGIEEIIAVLKTKTLYLKLKSFRIEKEVSQYIFWFDVKNHTVVKYDTNGLLAIGDVKMKTFFKEKSQVIIQDSLPNFVIGTYDDYNSEYIISLPKTGETVVTLQEDPYYPETPVIDTSNVSEEPTTKVVSVIVKAPWNITGQMTVIDGVGVFNFTSPYSFTIPADAITFPTGSSIAVVNASSGGFSQDSDSIFMPGTGSIVFSNVFGDSIDTIEIALNREIKGSTGKVNVLNSTDYTNDSSYLYGNILNGSTPFRITGASPSESLFLEEKELLVFLTRRILKYYLFLPLQS